MNNIKRKLGGRISKLEGERFENLLQSYAVCSKAKLLRIPDGCKTVRCGKKLVIRRVKSPFDFVLVKGPNVIFFDAKSINRNTFPKNLVNDFQINHLLDLEEHGYLSGYLIYFRKAHRIAFICAKRLYELKKGESVTWTDGLDLGSYNDIKLDPLFKTI